MDPITASLNLASAIVAFADKVFAATPQPLQAQVAADFSTFNHNISAFLLSIQAKINAAVAPKAEAQTPNQPLTASPHP